MEAGISDDYAVLYGNGFRFYYGYEETDAEGNWLFTAYYAGKEFQCTAQDLGCQQFDPPESVLLHGIGQFLEQEIRP